MRLRDGVECVVASTRPTQQPIPTMPGYIPDPDDEFELWFANFNTQFGNNFNTLGFVSADALAVTTASILPVIIICENECYNCVIRVGKMLVFAGLAL